MTNEAGEILLVTVLSISEIVFHAAITAACILACYAMIRGAKEERALEQRQRAERDKKR